MLTPEQIQAIANDVTEIYSGVESACIESIVKRIQAGKAVSEASLWQLKKMNDVGFLRRDILENIRVKTKLTIPEVDKLIYKALNSSRYANVISISGLKQYKTKKQALEELAKSPALAKTIKRLTHHCHDIINLTNTKALQGSVLAYTKAVNTAYLAMATGNATREEAIKEAVKQVGKSGIQIVDKKKAVKDSELFRKNGELYTTYKNGDSIRIYPLDSAIRRDLVTTINQASADLTIEDCKELGTHLVETSWHNGARPEHEVWQGQVFSLDPKDEKYPYFYGPLEAGLPAYGDPLGICGINCRHSFAPYFEGTEKTTKTGKKSAEENAKQYEAEQTQRAYERRLRGLKREQVALKAGGYTEDAQRVQGLINKTGKNYAQFLKETGLRRVTMLERVEGYQRMSVFKQKSATTTATSAITPAPADKAKMLDNSKLSNNMEKAYDKQIADSNIKAINTVYASKTTDKDVKALSEKFAEYAGDCPLYKDKKTSAWFSPRDNAVYLSDEYVTGAQRTRTLTGQTLPHEIGHWLDANTLATGLKSKNPWQDYYSWTYENNKLWKAIKADYKNALAKYTGQSFRNTSAFCYHVWKQGSMNKGNFQKKEAYLSVLDMIMGASSGKDVFIATHAKSYFAGTDGHKNACTEFFAEVMESISLGEDYYSVIKEFFPTAVSVVVEMIKKIAW